MPKKLSAKTAAEWIAAGKRQGAAVELYLKGWSMRRIAVELKYSGPSSVKKAIDSAIKKVPSPAVNELRIEIEERSRLMLEELDLIAMDRKKPLDDRLAAMDRIVKIDAERRKLHGADAPSKQTLQLSGDVNVTDVRKELLDRLARLADAGEEGEAPQPA